MRKWVHVLLLVLMALSGPVFGSPNYWMQMRLTPSEEVTIGSTVTLEVDVMADTWFKEPPRFSDLDLPGARVVFEGSKGRNLHITRDRRRYVGLTFSYRVVPATPGAFVIPALEVTLELGQTEQPVSLHTDPVRFVAILPEALAARGPTLMANQVNVTQQLKPNVRELAVGTPFVRELSVHAIGGEAMRMPPIELPNPTGLAGQRNSPKISALTNQRGQVIGAQRVDAVTYVADRPGSLTLPAKTLTWWNTASHQLVETTVPALELVIHPAPEVSQPFPVAEAIATMKPRFKGPLPLWGGLLLIVLFGVVWRKYFPGFWSKPLRWIKGSVCVGCFSPLYLRWRALCLLCRRRVDLLGIYRLQSHLRCSPHRRGAQELVAAAAYRQMLAQGLAAYYGLKPNRTLARRTLCISVFLLRKQAIDRVDSPSRVLPPLNHRDESSRASSSISKRSV